MEPTIPAYDAKRNRVGAEKYFAVKMGVALMALVCAALRVWNFRQMPIYVKIMHGNALVQAVLFLVHAEASNVPLVQHA